MSEQTTAEFTTDAYQSARNEHFRTFAEYAKTFGYTEENLKGKSILEVGSGDSDFATEAAKYGAKVARVDPQYRPRATDEELAEKPYLEFSRLGAPLDPRAAVAGIVQQLPYRDDAFDETIANFSMYWVSRGILQGLAEMLRVTRPNGLVKIWPASFTDSEPGNGETINLPLGAKMTRYDGEGKKDVLVIPKIQPGTVDQLEELNKLTGLVRFSNMLPPLSK